MNYGMLLWPHANARYQAEAERLGKSELKLMLSKICPGAGVAENIRPDLHLLEFSAPAPLDDDALSAIAGHSLMYVLFAMDGENMRPLRTRPEAYLDYDLPGILKYKGKTNEAFTSLTINAALYSTDFYSLRDTRLRFADPMCSKGTSLFLAANRGWDADGSDNNAADIREMGQFFKRYLEYHKLKHTLEHGSFTIKGEKPAPASIFTYAASIDSYRKGDKATLRMSVCDCGKTDACFGKARYHVISCDMPYGVQHSAGEESFTSLLVRSLPAWKNSLMPGGALAVSFNTNTLKTSVVRSLMEDSGFSVMRGGAYDGFTHWVEQAVTRDVAVGVKPRAL